MTRQLQDAAKTLRGYDWGHPDRKSNPEVVDAVWLLARAWVDAGGDLLAACKTAAMACEVYAGQSPLIDTALAQLLAAIAKAEGRS